HSEVLPMPCGRIAMKAVRLSSRVLPIIVAVLVLSGRALAQDASIVGVVTDESGAVLPGVTVTVSSPALQVATMTVVTDTRGEYRATPLPIGTYSVEYMLSGFNTIRREGIILTASFVAKLDAQMKVGQLQETVTVTGASPVVDVVSTTSATRLTRETLDT